MKFITFLFTLFLSSQALAHPGHGMEEGFSHTLFHAVFWGLFAIVAYKGFVYFKSKKKKNSEH